MAVAITGMLVALMLIIVTNVLKGWNRSTGNLSSGNQARLVLNLLSQDIQTALIRKDATNTWLVATIQQDQTGIGDSGLNDPTLVGTWTAAPGGVVKPIAAIAANKSFIVDKSQSDNPTDTLALENYRFGQAGVWLRLFSIPPETNGVLLSTTSAPRAVSYQLIRARVGGANSTQFSYLFFRSETRPADDTGGGNSTFSVGYDLLNNEGNVLSYNNSTNSTSGINPNGNRNDQNVNSIRRPAASLLLANNVIDFGVKIYGSDPSGNMIELFPVPRAAPVAPGSPSLPQGPLPTSSNVPYTYAASGRTDWTTSPPVVTGLGTRLSPYELVTSAGSLYGSTSGINAYPVTIDVMVRILSDEGARQIANIEAGTIPTPTGVTPSDFWWQTAIANSQVYTRRIQIKSTPL